MANSPEQLNAIRDPVGGTAIVGECELKSGARVHWFTGAWVLVHWFLGFGFLGSGAQVLLFQGRDLMNRNRS